MHPRKQRRLLGLLERAQAPGEADIQSRGLLHARTCAWTQRWNQEPSQDSSWLDGHALSFVLEGLVHERRQVSLAVAREDHLRGTTNKSDLQR